MFYRVYFNNSLDRQHWSVDQGAPGTEITVMQVILDGVTASTCYRPGIQPRAWFHVEGELTIKDGVAVIKRNKS